MLFTIGITLNPSPVRKNCPQNYKILSKPPNIPPIIFNKIFRI